MKFDVHCHAFLTTGFVPKGKRMDDNFFLTVKGQLEMFDYHNIDKGLLLPVLNHDGFPYLQTMREIEDIVALHPDKFLYFMNMDPRMFMNDPKADFSRYIEYHLERGARGVGELSANLPWEHPLMDNMLYHINKYKLPFTFHISPTPYYVYGIYDDYNLSGLERVLNKYPDIRFFGHSAEFWSRISGDTQYRDYPKGPVEPGGPVVRLLETYPNLYGDMSAGSGLNALTRDPEFTKWFLDHFQDKLLFGTDFCGYVPKGTMTLSEFLDDRLADGSISQQVYDKVCWNNAAKQLGFETLDQLQQKGADRL